MIYYIDNWSALLIAIFQEIEPNKALQMVGISVKDKTDNKRKWTAEDIEDIAKLREQGLKWNEIAQIFCTTELNIKNTYHYHRHREREKELEIRKQEYKSHKVKSS